MAGHTSRRGWRGLLLVVTDKHLRPHTFSGRTARVDPLLEVPLEMDTLVGRQRFVVRQASGPAAVGVLMMRGSVAVHFGD